MKKMKLTEEFTRASLQTFLIKSPFLLGNYPLAFANTMVKMGLGNAPIYSLEKWKSLNPKIKIRAKPESGLKITKTNKDGFNSIRLYTKNELITQSTTKGTETFNQDIHRLPLIRNANSEVDKYLNRAIRRANLVRFSKEPVKVSRCNTLEPIPKNAKTTDLIGRLKEYSSKLLSENQRRSNKIIDPVLSTITKINQVDTPIDEPTKTFKNKSPYLGSGEVSQPSFMLSDYDEPEPKFHGII